MASNNEQGLVVEQGAEEEKSRRRASKKPAALSAKHMDSSPVRSEDDLGLLSFGEPSRRRALVKVTYAKRPKSPNKVTPEKSSLTTSSQTPRSRLPAPDGGSKSLPPMRRQARAQIHRKPAKRQRAKSSTALFDGSMSPLSESEDDAASVHSDTPRIYAVAKEHTSTRPRAAKRKKSLKRSQSISSLSSLSSEGEVGDLQRTAIQSSPPPVTSRLMPASGRNGASFRTLTRTRTEPAPLISRQLTRTLTMPNVDAINAGWGLHDHDLAFVRVNELGQLSEFDEGMWWPAKLVGTEPMRVTLFGEYPGSSPDCELVIAAPSSAVIRPFCAAPRQLRFTDKTYASYAPPTDSLSSPPRKRQKTLQADFDDRWYRARDSMLKHYQRMNDGLPLKLSLLVRDDSPEFLLPLSQAQETARNTSSSPLSEASELDDSWDAGPSPYDVPGELVLAREKPTFTQYWPAKLMRYIPPLSRGKKARYQVLFFDDQVKTLADDSDMFYNEAHPKFKSCVLGDDVANYGLTVGEQDEGADQDLLTHSSDNHFTEEQIREPTPEPRIPAPLAFAAELSIDEQFEYTKPILVGILTGHYGPAKDKHIRFMKGGKQRNTVTEAAWKSGEVTITQKTQLSACIQKWMQKRQRQQELGILPADPYVEIEMDAVAQPGSNTDPKDTQRGNAVAAPGEAIEEQPMANDMQQATSSVGVPLTGVREARPSSDAIAVLDCKNANAPGSGSDPKPPADMIDLTLDIEEGRDISVCETAISAQPPTVVTDTNPDAAPSGTVPTYSMLSKLDQITYCTSVLLPEAILQILLWRNGQREQTTLLSSEEEEKLHRLGETYASATYWVHDVIHMKRAAEGKLLPPSSQPEPADNTPRASRLRSRRK